MFLQWQNELNIGVPEIDAEHRYLVALVNNLYEKISANSMEGNLTDTFVHLIRYVDRHFKNEEGLMQIAGYPALQEHQKQHESLEDRVSELAESYLTGGEHINAETMDFLKDWVTDHILKEDAKIGHFIGDRDFSGQWDHVPAFAESSGARFKHCSYCEKEWKTFEDLENDKEISAVNCMLDQYNHFYNLILFNCSCGTTLAIQLIEFIEHGVGTFELEERNASQPRPDYCQNKGMSAECLPKCACAYTSDILKRLG